MDDEKKLNQNETTAVSGGGIMPDGEDVTPGEGSCCPNYACSECGARPFANTKVGGKYLVFVNHESVCPVGQDPKYRTGGGYYGGGCENCSNWLGGENCDMLV